MKCILILLALLVILAPSPAHAGVTIHYEGYVLSTGAVTKAIAIATAFARKHGWRVEDASATTGRIPRVINEVDRDYKGKITGITIYPAPMCEPLTIQFGDDLFMQDFVKTQFAGSGVHIEIVTLFDALAPLFKKLDIVDEGDYWESRDRTILEGHMSKINSILQDMLSKNPKAQGPLIMPSGRIADYVN